MENTITVHFITLSHNRLEKSLGNGKEQCVKRFGTINHSSRPHVFQKFQKWAQK